MTTVIVGGGLSGLYCALLLHRRGEDFVLLEARDRLGGRIVSELVSEPPAVTGPAFDLGPSWFWPGFQPRIRELLEELGIETFPQPTDGEAVFEDEAGQRGRFPGYGSEPRSFRIEGGTARLIEELARRLPSEKIHRSMAVRRVSRLEESVRLEVAPSDGTRPTQSMDAERVLLAAPPRLMVRSLDFEPQLPEALKRQLVAIPTWMAGHAKVVTIYDQPVWRQRGLSGQGFSQRGPLAEIHDASPREGGPYALFGFVGLSAAERRALGDGLAEASVRQLDRLFGPGLPDPVGVRVKDWSDDPWTATEEDHQSPNGHPTYGLPAAAEGLWDGRLCFCSTETSAANGGYLEGALEAAIQALR